MNSPSQSITSTHANNTALDTSKLYQEGFVAGTLGAVVVALWFLILDLIQGHPLFTPTLLGTALFKGIGALPAIEKEAVSLEMVAGFTFVHWLVFVILGCIASRLLGMVERNSNLGFGILLLFVVFEFGFLAAATVFAKPIIQELTWVTILLGNLLAAFGMGWYFWRRHPNMTIYP